MSTEEGPDPAAATFADVLNGLTLGAARPRKRPPEARGQPVPPPRTLVAPPPEPPAEPPGEENAASVRAYAWTGGRTRARGRLEIETLVSTSAMAAELFHTMRSEHQSVARLCQRSRSVAEIAALLNLPIGVVRVLLDDMAGLGLVTVHRNQTTGTGQPDLELLGRVLRGLTNLGT